MPNAYPAAGRPLPLGNYSVSPPEPIWAAMRTYDFVIPDGEYSFWDDVSDARSFTFQIQYDATPSGSTIIEIASDPSFSDAIPLDTLPMSTDKLAIWTTRDDAHYTGCVRISNNSGEDINKVFFQKEVTAGGAPVL